MCGAKSQLDLEEGERKREIGICLICQKMTQNSIMI